jgi:hypothetical protein
MPCHAASRALSGTRGVEVELEPPVEDEAVPRDARHVDLVIAFSTV